MFGQPAAVGNNKPVCNFFLKGTCKYGAQCWNFHPQNQGGTGNTFLGGATSAQVFGGKPAAQVAQQDPKKEFQDFVKQVSGEMTQWERSGQWQVSSFSPIKGHPLFPGFNDTSPEEFRLKAYEALKNNTSGTYQAHWGEMLQRFKQLREAVKASTPEAIQAVKEVFFTKSSAEGQTEQQQQQQALKSANVFGKPAGVATPSIFGGASAQPGTGTGLLGDKPQQSLVFGGSSNVFGGNQPASPMFGGSSTSKPVFGSQPLLGNQSTGTFSNQPSNVFGGNTGNIFKSANQSAQSSTLFGGAQGHTNTASVFGGASNSGTTQTPTSGNIFGEQKAAGTSVFSTSNPAQPSVFGRPAAPPGTTNTMGGQGSVFGGGGQQPQTGGLFGNPPPQQPQSPSVFGSSVFGSTAAPPTAAAPATPQPQPQPQPSVFGGSAAPPVFGGTPNKGGNIFGGSGGFGTNTQPGSGVFGATPSGNVFASASTPSNTGIPGLFGKPADPTQSSIIPGGTGLFGDATLSSQSSGTSTMAKEHADWYTPLDQLKPEERAQFEAEVFTSIPLCPPPIELCA